LQKTTDGAPRPTPAVRPARHRAPLVTRLNRRSVGVARATQDWVHGHAGSPARTLRASLVRVLRPLTTAERALPVAVAAIVAVASLLALLPSTPAGTVGGAQGSGQDVRLAVNGGVGRSSDAMPFSQSDASNGSTESFMPIVLPDGVPLSADAAPAAAGSANAVVTSDSASTFLDDGTLVTGYAPETTVEDGAGLIAKYKVKPRDTLSGIAHKFGVSMMTLWWANKLESKDALHVGQILRIPSVNGLVVTVTDTDTLDSLAAQYGVRAARITSVNGLVDSTLVLGQVLMIPGAKGEPIPTPKPTPKPAAPRASSGGGHHYSRPTGPTHYAGGRMHWPVVGGNNYVSQGFHYGHTAIDIAADYGATVVAAAGGQVEFAGWKSNGGGWQVWISHGNGIHTTYNHMSGLTVHTGQVVGRGQQVGRIGSSGWATGPHLHFEVWIGPIWSGGQPVNPMRYL
jgi:murein DD-endopeptidase MepM/ murein hydrolase activator NlpD